MIGSLRPHETVDDAATTRGLRALLLDGVCSQVMGAVTSGAVLVAFAVLLGASNTVIGLLAAVGPLTQILQIPAVLLVDRTRLRKLLVVVSSLLSRVIWLIVAALPWIVPADQRVAVLLVCLLLYFGLGTISSCAFNSWMRDFVPESIMGDYFGKRLAVATAVGAVLTLLVGALLTFGKSLFASPFSLYSLLFLLGAAVGLMGVVYLSRIPEPRMQDGPTRSIVATLREPLVDGNYRQLLLFLGTWNFAINLAAPFFTVYMLKRLGLSMALVLAFSVVSQITNALFLRLWGPLADRYSNKSVLAVSGPLFILSILIWPFTTMPDPYFLTIPLVVAIHVLAGVSTAGVTLCSSNIALKAAPRGQATAYLATSSLVNGIAATIAPILAGIGADWFALEELSLSLRWTSVSEGPRFDVPAFSLRGLDFMFVVSVVVGLYALHRRITVREQGEVEEAVVASELFGQVRKAARHVSNVAGLRQLTYFPYETLKKVVSPSSKPTGQIDRTPPGPAPSGRD